MADTLTDALQTLLANVGKQTEEVKLLEARFMRLESETETLCAENARLRLENTHLHALNTELSLKNENLLYWIQTRIQAVVN
ncbi:MAG: hypothetical protein V4563_14685 [Pseudomonadota bacterium]